MLQSGARVTPQEQISKAGSNFERQCLTNAPMEVSKGPDIIIVEAAKNFTRRAPIHSTHLQPVRALKVSASASQASSRLTRYNLY